VLYNMVDAPSPVGHAGSVNLCYLTFHLYNLGYSFFCCTYHSIYPTDDDKTDYRNEQPDLSCTGYVFGEVSTVQ
jgi:hypothetical protein